MNLCIGSIDPISKEAKRAENGERQKVTQYSIVDIRTATDKYSVQAVVVSFKLLKLRMTR